MAGYGSGGAARLGDEASWPAAQGVFRPSSTATGFDPCAGADPGGTTHGTRTAGERRPRWPARRRQGRWRRGGRRARGRRARGRRPHERARRLHGAGVADPTVDTTPAADSLLLDRASGDTAGVRVWIAGRAHVPGAGHAAGRPGTPRGVTAGRARGARARLGALGRSRDGTPRWSRRQRDASRTVTPVPRRVRAVGATRRPRPGAPQPAAGPGRPAPRRPRRGCDQRHRPRRAGRHVAARPARDHRPACGRVPGRRPCRLPGGRRAADRWRPAAVRARRPRWAPARGRACRAGAIGRTGRGDRRARGSAGRVPAGRRRAASGRTRSHGRAPGGSGPLRDRGDHRPSGGAVGRRAGAAGAGRQPRGRHGGGGTGQPRRAARPADGVGPAQRTGSGVAARGRRRPGRPARRTRRALRASRPSRRRDHPARPGRRSDPDDHGRRGRPVPRAVGSHGRRGPRRGRRCPRLWRPRLADRPGGRPRGRAPRRAGDLPGTGPGPGVRRHCPGHRRVRLRHDRASDHRDGDDHQRGRGRAARRPDPRCRESRSTP